MLTSTTFLLTALLTICVVRINAQPSCAEVGCGTFGTAGGPTASNEQWCKCCGTNCGGFQQACITNDNWCQPGGRCLNTMTNYCPTPAPTPPPTPPPTPMPPTPEPTPEPTPFPTPMPTPDPCSTLSCDSGFGVPGSPKWCNCCGYDCGGNRDSCLTNSGFCSTRCETHPTCPTTTTTTMMTTTPMPTPVPTPEPTPVPPTPEPTPEPTPQPTPEPTTTTTTAAATTTTTAAPASTTSTAAAATTTTAATASSGATTSAPAATTTATATTTTTAATTSPAATTPNTAATTTTTTPAPTTTTTAAATTTTTAPATTTTTPAPTTTTTAAATTTAAPVVMNMAVSFGENSTKVMLPGNRLQVNAGERRIIVNSVDRNGTATDIALNENGIFVPSGGITFFQFDTPVALSRVVLGDLPAGETANLLFGDDLPAPMGRKRAVLELSDSTDTSEATRVGFTDFAVQASNADQSFTVDIMDVAMPMPADVTTTPPPSTTTTTTTTTTAAATTTESLVDTTTTEVGETTTADDTTTTVATAAPSVTSESTDSSDDDYSRIFPEMFLPWDRWGTIDGMELEDQMSDIYGFIMFGGALLCLILLCVVICCCCRKKKTDDADSQSKAGYGTNLNSTGEESYLLRRGTDGIPILVEDLIEYLEERAMDTPGIFRESGKAELVEEILDGYESNQPVDLSRVNDKHAVAVALKTYYKKRLQAPFLDVEFAGDYLRHKDAKPASARIRAQRAVIDRMAPSKVDELRALLGFLHRVAQRKSKNKMDARNLAIVFGPALFQSAFIVEATDVVVLLIQDYEPLFEGAPADSQSAGDYSTESGSGGEPLGKVRALYDYEPLGNNPGEMRLDEGDIISLIEDVDENGWAQGSVKGRVGWFPMSYCERLDGSDSSSYGESSMYDSSSYASSKYSSSKYSASGEYSSSGDGSSSGEVSGSYSSTEASSAVESSTATETSGEETSSSYASTESGTGVTETTESGSDYSSSYESST